jgi:hypothetical protein
VTLYVKKKKKLATNMIQKVETLGEMKLVDERNEGVDKNRE